MRSHADWKAGSARLAPVAPGHRRRAAATHLRRGRRGARDASAGRRTARRSLFSRAGQLHLLPADGGEARALTHHATDVTAAIPPAVDPRRLRRLFHRVRSRARPRSVSAIGCATMCTRSTRRRSSSVTSGRSSSRPAPKRRSRRANCQCSGSGCRARREAHRAPPRAVSAEADAVPRRSLDRWTRTARMPALSRSNTLEETGGRTFARQHARCCSWPTTNERFEPYYNTNLFVRPGWRRHAPRSCCPTSSTRSNRRRGRRRPIDLRRGQHGRPQRGLPDRDPVRGRMQAADRRQAFHPARTGASSPGAGRW